MTVVYRTRAINAILKVALFVESQNTPGSGDVWYSKLNDFIHSLAKSKAKFQICKDPSLARYQYRCYAYKDWIITFRIHPNEYEVCRFILGKRLNY
jgi:hypothetical protein